MRVSSALGSASGRSRAEAGDACASRERGGWRPASRSRVARASRAACRARSPARRGPARAGARRRAARSRRSRGARRGGAGGPRRRSRPAAGAAWWSTRAITTRSAPRRACADLLGERRRPRRRPRAAARWAGPTPRARAAQRASRAGAAIDRDHALVERRQQRQQGALAGADVDRERAAGQQRRRAAAATRASSASSAAGRGASSARQRVEQLLRQLLALRDHARRSSRGCRRGCTARRPSVERAASITTSSIGSDLSRVRVPSRRAAQQADLAQRLGLLGDLRLALAEELRELADRQLLLGAQREQPQAILVARGGETDLRVPRLHLTVYILIIRMKAIARKHASAKDETFRQAETLGLV